VNCDVLGQAKTKPTKKLPGNFKQKKGWLVGVMLVATGNRVWDSVASQGTHGTEGKGSCFATYVTPHILVELKSSGGWIHEGSRQVDSEGSTSQVG
jgi:hypothetical protein